VSSWISRIDRVLALKPRVVVGGHGPASTRAVADLALTRDYLATCARRSPRRSTRDSTSRPPTGASTGRATRHLPAFEAANRRNAYQTYLNVEQEALQAAKGPRRP
jgi:hypothetical protein